MAVKDIARKSRAWRGSLGRSNDVKDSEISPGRSKVGKGIARKSEAGRATQGARGSLWRIKEVQGMARKSRF